MSNTQKVITFGCRLNIYESEIIKQNLIKSNEENIVVFNTCAVTKQAEKQAKQAIRKLYREDPSKRIIVTGCAAQNNPEMFAAMQEVDKIIGNEEKLTSKHYHINSEKIVVSNIMSIKNSNTNNHNITNFEGKTRAFIQVQNGCDHRCTFCMIPYARGNSRSVPLGVIVEQARKLYKNGYKEIVITGVDVTAYGMDLPGQPTFAQMIRRLLLLVPELRRVRLSSIDVAEIDNELFNLMAYNNKLMPHFHISLQSGDNMILKRMKRRHTREEVIKFCHSLRNIRPSVSFGADIIAGFPTETDSMFENTRKLISEAGIQYLHIFPYSERAKTPAAKMPPVPTHIRKNRASILRTEGNKELKKFFNKQLGCKVQLLVENNNMAHSENFIPVKLENQLTSGQIINATLVSLASNYMLAKIIKT